MAFELITEQVGCFKAAQDLTNLCGHAVRLNNVRRYQLATTGEDAHGILRTPARSGQVCDVVVFGITRAIAGEAFPAGRPLSVNVNGRLVESSGGAIVAYSVGTSTGDGSLIEVFVGARGGVNVILDSESGLINPGETVLVDSADSTLVRAATWLVTIVDVATTGTEYFMINAAHIAGSATHQKFGWNKVGTALPNTVSVTLNIIDNLLELKVNNTGTVGILVKALRISAVAV